MAITKSSLFTPEQQKLADLYKSLGHPARIAILQLLQQKQRCVCGDLTEELPLAQSTVSQHLKALKQAGLIKGEIEGPKTCYCLSEYGLEQFNKLILPVNHQDPHSHSKNCC